MRQKGTSSIVHSENQFGVPEATTFLKPLRSDVGGLEIRGKAGR
jgi:hypothetical protein